MDEIVPRPNNSAPATIRKSAFGRTHLFVKDACTLFREIKCSSSTFCRSSSTSLYHTHNDDGNKTACWHCCHPFEGEKMCLPRAFDPVEKVYHVYGCFCSPSCGCVVRHTHTAPLPFFLCVCPSLSSRGRTRPCPRASLRPVRVCSPPTPWRARAEKRTSSSTRPSIEATR